MSDATNAINADLRARLSGSGPAPGSETPDPVRTAAASLSDALTTNDAAAIVAADDALAAALNAEAPRRDYSSWGAGGRRTPAAGRSMTDELRRAFRDPTHPARQ